MRTDYIMEFADVCVACHSGLEMYTKTMKIYDFLKENKGQEFSPTAIGLSMGEPFMYHLSWDDSDEACVKTISDSLHWLEKMGLISRNTYTKVVEIDLGYRQRVRDVKIIDGVEYVGYIYKDIFTKEVKYYKWFAL